MPPHIEALDTTLCVHLDLLVTGVCSRERAASCVSSCARLQWVTWREVDTQMLEPTILLLNWRHTRLE